MTETYAYGTIKGLVSKKEEIKYSNIKTIENMINFDDVIKEEAKEHNRTWPEISDQKKQIHSLI